MKAKSKRLALDIGMTVLMIAAMFVQVTGIFAHEIIGFAFFGLVAIHIALSANWIRKTAAAMGKTRTSTRRKWLAVMGILLALVGGLLAISSIAISTILKSAGFNWTLGDYGTWATIHSVSSYVLCGLVVIHLAMHWSFIASAMKVVYAPENRRKIGAGVYASAMFGAGALGFAALGEMPRTTSASPSELVSTKSNENSATETGQNTGQESPSSSVSSSEITQSRKTGKHSRSQSVSTGNGSSGQTAPPSSSNGFSQPQADNTGSYSAGEEPEETEPLPTGICTLCGKHCSLSSPRCDRPYREGLITTEQSR